LLKWCTKQNSNHSCRPPQDPAAGAAARGTLGLMTPWGVTRPRVPPVSPTTHPTKNPGREVFSHSTTPYLIRSTAARKTHTPGGPKKVSPSHVVSTLDRAPGNPQPRKVFHHLFCIRNVSPYYLLSLGDHKCPPKAFNHPARGKLLDDLLNPPR
jgi:hypothetical protein